jgi:uncharacterized OsmC-like protein
MSDRRLTYSVRARVVGPGVSRAEVAGKTETIALDTSAGQSASLPGPADLLVAAFAACVLKNVERMSGLQPFPYEGAEIEVTAEREDRPPRIGSIRYRLVVITEEPQRRVDLLHHNIARQGTIYNTLAQSCDVRGEIVAVPPGTQASQQDAEAVTSGQTGLRPGDRV